MTDDMIRAVIAAGAASVLGFLIAFTIMKLLPDMTFKGDKPLRFGKGAWFMPILALVVTGASVALVLTQELSYSWYVPLAPISAILAVLTMTDIKFHRLPNGVMAILYALTIVTLPIPVILTGDWEAFARFGIGFAITAAIFFILALTGMGGGDLKLIPIIFATLSAISWETAIIWIVAGWVGAGIWAVGEGIAQRSLKGTLPMIPGFTAGFIALPILMLWEPLANLGYLFL